MSQLAIEDLAVALAHPVDQGLDTTDGVRSHEESEGSSPPSPNPLEETQNGVLSEDDKKGPSDEPPSPEIQSPSKPKIGVATTGKANGGPTTPTVKKVLNSGTFGSGAVKVPAAKAMGTLAASKNPTASTAPVLKKSTSASAATGKPVTTASRPTPATNSAPAPNRRASVVPAKPPAAPATKPPLSSSTNSKPAAAATGPRPSVVSPVGSAASLKSAASAAKPRASVSAEATKRPIPTKQGTVNSVSKPASSTLGGKPIRTVTSSATAPKPGRPTSIASIREVQEADNSQALQALELKLKEATKSLEFKADAVISLEAEIQTLKQSLEVALSDVKEKTALLGDLEKDRSATEDLLAQTTSTLEKLQSERLSETSTAESFQQELTDAKAAAGAQEAVVKQLQAEVDDLTAKIQASEASVKSLQDAHASSAANVAQEQESFQKALSQVKSLEEEIELLKGAQRQASDQVVATQSDLENRASRIQSLESQIAELRAEKEDTATKLSEVEIEVLELKEAQDAAEEYREQTEEKIKLLETQLEAATAALEQAKVEAATKEQEAQQKLAALKAEHESQLAALSEERIALNVKLEGVDGQLTEARDALAKAQADADAAAAAHNHEVEQAKQAFATRETELKETINEVTAELQNQESIYNSKVEAIKVEHEDLLKAAFERAKNEAGEAHSLELQKFRSESTATISQIQAANQAGLQELRAEHSSAMETEIKNSEKQISNLNLDLQVTQDSLTKAKAALETARSEVELLSKQRDEARTAAANVEPSAELTAEVVRLTKEMSNKQDDLNAMTEMLSLTKTSLAEISNNHTKELEEAAKGRAEEVTRLRALHDEEITTLARTKSDLLMRLSDLEGELATLKANQGAEATAPKTNGHHAAQPSSPGVTKEELQKMHEAHNLKIYDLMAEHDKAVKNLKEQYETAQVRTEELQQEVGRKAMEIQYLEQEQEENQETITRLKEDLDAANEKLHA